MREIQAYNSYFNVKRLSVELPRHFDADKSDTGLSLLNIMNISVLWDRLFYATLSA